jgi:tRNA-dihydrouridine synthase B
VHGRTREQGYSGAADWNVIAEVADAVAIPVIGNGDLSGPTDVAKRRKETGIAGVMIGRAAMSAPWIFRQTKRYLLNGEVINEPSLAEKWKIILRHCQLNVEHWGVEEPAIRSMRARLMAYSKGLPESKKLREKFQHASTLNDIDVIAQNHLPNTVESEARVSN